LINLSEHDLAVTINNQAGITEMLQENQIFDVGGVWYRVDRVIFANVKH